MMNSYNATSEFSTLNWVKKQIDENLVAARLKLQSIEEDDEDIRESMQSCAEELHQVQGSLKMVELYGASMIAEEMEKVARALADGSITNQNDGYSALMSGVIQLPGYLDNLQSGHQDIPTVLLPLLNDLRTARGEKLVSEGVLFSPNLNKSLPTALKAEVTVAADEDAAKLRSKFQLSLLNWIKNEDPENHLKQMVEITGKLRQISTQDPSRKMFWAAEGVLEAVQADGLEVTASLKKLIGQFDRELKRFIDEGEDAFLRQPPDETTRSLLYYIANSKTTTPTAQELKQHYQLGELLPKSEELAYAKESISGKNKELLDTVSKAIKEDFYQVKDALDVYLTDAESTPATLEPHVEKLNTIADTLGMLGLGISRKKIIEQADALKTITSGDLEASEENLMGIAGTLLFIESTLDDELKEVIVGPSAKEEPIAEKTTELKNQPPQAEVKRVIYSLMDEAIINIAATKQQILQYLEDIENKTFLENIPNLLNQVSGALIIVNLVEASKITTDIKEHITNHLIPLQSIPASTHIELLAEAISGLELFLEAVRDQSPLRHILLGKATEFTNKLKSLPTDIDKPVEIIEDQLIPSNVVSTQIETKDSSANATFLEDIDDDIREIFIDEFSEELESIQSNYPAWKNNQEDKESLNTLRRSFHTLKGSGRLVGAKVIGEFSWAIENLLNRIIDGTRRVNNEIFNLLDQAVDTLPQLLNQLKEGTAPTADIESIEQQAHQLTKFEKASESQEQAVVEEQVTPGVSDTEQMIKQPADESNISQDDDVAAESLSENEIPEDTGAKEITEEAPIAEEGLIFDLVEEVEQTDISQLLQDNINNLEDSEEHISSDQDLALQLTEEVEETDSDFEVTEIQEDTAADEEKITLELSEPTEEVMDAASGLVEEESLTTQDGVEDELTIDLDDVTESQEVVTSEEEITLELGEPTEEVMDAASELVEEESSTTQDGVEDEFTSKLDDVTDTTLLSDEAEPVVVPDDVEKELTIDLDEIDKPADETQITEIEPEVVEPQEVVTDEEEITLELDELADEMVESTPELIEEETTDAMSVSTEEEVFTTQDDTGEELTIDLDEIDKPADETQITEIEPEVVEPQEVVTDEEEITLELDELADEMVESTSELIEKEAVLTQDDVDEELTIDSSETTETTTDVTEKTDSEIESLEEDEFDPILLEIFGKEASGHLETVNAYLTQANKSKDPVSASVDLLVALHTLHGAACMADVQPIAELSAAMEGYVKRLRPQNLAPDQEGLKALNDGANSLNIMLQQFKLDSPDYPASSELISQLHQLRDELPEIESSALDSILAEEMEELELDTTVDVDSTKPSQEAMEEQVVVEAEIATVNKKDDFYEQIDPELLDIFLEEAQEILEKTNVLLEELNANDQQNQKNTLDGFQRELHTLKGGSRMAGIESLGEMAHQIESFIEQYIVDATIIDDKGISLIQRGFDNIHDQVSRLINREEIVSDQPLINEILEALGEDPQAQQIVEEKPHKVVEGTTILEEAMEKEKATKKEKIITKKTEAKPREGLEKGKLPLGTHPEFGPISSVALMTGNIIPFKAKITSTRKSSTTANKSADVIRINSDQLDNFVNNTGEISIYRARLDQQVNSFKFNLVELEQTVSRIRSQLRQLEIETEAQILSRYQREGEPSKSDFDPLELDRFSRLQQLSRTLAETLSDLISIEDVFENLTKDSETLLLQQSRVIGDLQQGLMGNRMVPFSNIVPRLQRILRNTTNELNKKASLTVTGAEGEMDRTVLEKITPALEHMLRNAIDHGLESEKERKRLKKSIEGKVNISVAREASEILITITDDGKGIDLARVKEKAIEKGLLKQEAELGDHEIINFITEAGFSTAEKVTKVSGRGVGMDVVNNEIKQLNGSLHINSTPKKGTEFTIRLPFSLSVSHAIMINMGNEQFAVPLASIEGIYRMPRSDFEEQIKTGESKVTYAGKDYQVFDLGLLLGKETLGVIEDHNVPLLMIKTGDLYAAVRVEHLYSNREIVIKSVGAQVASIPGISGATILGDGKVILILDLPPLVRKAAALRLNQEEIVNLASDKQDINDITTVLVVDDSITMRKVATRMLEKNNMVVVTAKDGVDAISKLHTVTPDIVLLDIEMPRMDGYEFAAYMRNSSKLKEIPIIMITSRTGEKHKQRALEIGVNRYIGKPYQEEHLLENMNELLN